MGLVSDSAVKRAYCLANRESRVDARASLTIRDFDDPAP